jgi:hypothetical protein
VLSKEIACGYVAQAQSAGYGKRLRAFASARRAQQD